MIGKFRRMKRLSIRSTLSLLACAAFLLLAAAAQASPKAAVFDFDFINTSLEGSTTGTREDEIARLDMISDQLRTLMTESGKFDVIDVSSKAEEISRVNLQGCNGCDAKFARELGADLAVTGTVQKVSNLILNINIYVRDAQSKKLLRVMSADIRGNTDQSWSRGLSWLVRNRLLKE